MKKERLFYLDFVRAIATISIVITHFNARYLYLNPPMPQKAVITTTVANIYIGGWGVSLFFIISGAALMYVYQEKCELKTFYKKRFLNIYPMFWIAYIAAFAYMFYVNKVAPGGGAPKINLIFSILGFDGLLAENIPTFYILGEWFLGAIILMYLLFPIIRKGILEKPAVTWGIILVIYAWLILGYHYNFNVDKIIFIRMPEILFGMQFVKQNRKFDIREVVVATIILILNTICKPTWSSALQTSYVGIASFIVLVYLYYFLKNKLAVVLCGIVSKYSYAIFLVHHIIIAHMMATFDLNKITHLQSYELFISVFIVICIFAKILYEVHANIMQVVAKVIQKD